MKDDYRRLLEIRTLRLDAARRNTHAAKTNRDRVAQEKETSKANLETFRRTRANAEREALEMLKKAPVSPEHLLRHREGFSLQEEHEANLSKACETAAAALEGAIAKYEALLELQQSQNRAKEKVGELTRLERQRRERATERADEEVIDEWVNANRARQ